jgi:hypothetical protein
MLTSNPIKTEGTLSCCDMLVYVNGYMYACMHIFIYIC